MQEGLDWKHTRECVRMTYTMFPEDVEAAIKVIGDEVEKAFSE
ncbi:hypothetical protein N9139_02120 [Akkermansiaceae bacterium]|nr:hypothetical protein [Akkermansiaceae bacterium]